MSKDMCVPAEALHTSNVCRFFNNLRFGERQQCLSEKQSTIADCYYKNQSTPTILERRFSDIEINEVRTLQNEETDIDCTIIEELELYNQRDGNIVGQT